jgi:hypothetical protein
MDLVGRKLALGGGAVVEGFFALMESDIMTAGSHHGAGRIARATVEALNVLRDTTALIQGADVNAAGAAAVEYLRLFALVSFGWMWTRMAQAATGETQQHMAKRIIADFFADRMLPQATALGASIAAGEGSILALPEDAF